MSCRCSQAAPLSAVTSRSSSARWVCPFSEGYGLTETSPIITTNRPTRIEFGTVGQVLRGVDVKIAEDGEILARGPNIMKGYYKEPEATAATIDGDGWLHTGDLGSLDDQNFLRITGRKKEIIIMSNGKNVAPDPVERVLWNARSSNARSSSATTSRSSPC